MNVAPSTLSAGEWVLAYEIKGKRIGLIDWMYVDFVVRVERTDRRAFESDFAAQAVQVFGPAKCPEAPFELTRPFRTAFRVAIEEYGIAKLRSARSLAVPRSVEASVVAAMASSR